MQGFPEEYFPQAYFPGGSTGNSHRGEGGFILHTGAVLKLPDKYKSVIYLFYYEGYTAVEIAGILHKKENTVYTWMNRARQMLKDMVGGDVE